MKLLLLSSRRRAIHAGKVDHYVDYLLRVAPRPDLHVAMVQSDCLKKTNGIAGTATTIKHSGPGTAIYTHRTMKFPPGYVPGSGVHKASGFGGFGERLLRQHGWEKGEGLGKNKTGRAEAIQVKKKEDSAGVREP